MKIFRRVSAFSMVVALLLSMSLSVLAADYNAANVDDLFVAFGDTSGEDVNINVTADIDAGNYGFDAQEGISYNIGSENGSTLGNIGFGGEGSVVVDTDVNGDVFSYGEADVTVNGDVAGDVSASGDSSMVVESDVDGSVSAGGTAEVTVDGSVSGEVYAHDDSVVAVAGDVDSYVSAGGTAEVTVDGDVDGSVNAYEEGVVTVEGNVGEYVVASDNAEVDVGGDVTGSVDAFEDSVITVEGDVGEYVYTDGNAEVAVGGDVDGYMNAHKDSVVTVAGDVSEHVHTYGATAVTVDGSIDGDIYAHEDSVVAVAGDVDGYVSAGGTAEVAVGGDVNGSVQAMEDASVAVDGSVHAEDGTPEVDYEDPDSGSYGGEGVYADDNATVTVGGDVSGGDGYGTTGYGGSAVSAYGNATVTVGGDATGGNVTADPDTKAENYVSMSGSGVQMESTATVSVGGNVTAGSNNADSGYAGYGAAVMYVSAEESGSLTVGGTVSGGKSTSEEVVDLILVKYAEEDLAMPSIVIGSCSSIEGFGFDEEALEDLKADVKAKFTKKTITDFFWINVQKQILAAKAGDEVTIDVKDRTYIPASVIEAALRQEVTLIIKWNGGEDLVIDKTFTEEVRGFVALKDLAEMLKK